MATRTHILAPAGSASLGWGGLGESEVWRRYNFQRTQERAWMWSQRVDLTAQIRLWLWAFVRESYRTCRTMNSHGGWQPVNHNNGTRKDMAYPKVVSFSSCRVCFPPSISEWQALRSSPLSIYYSHFAFSPSCSMQETGIEVRDGGRTA